MTTRQSFQDIYIGTLTELYQIEFQFAASLPRLGTFLKGTELAALPRRAELQSDIHLNRLEEVFDLLDFRASCEPCWRTSRFMIEACEAAQSRHSFSRVAGVAIALLSVKNLEILNYRAVSAWSSQCGLEEIFMLLRPSLNEEAAFIEELMGYVMSGGKTGLQTDDLADLSIN